MYVFSSLCECRYNRFAQRSMDHRGNPEFPGIVATLVEDDNSTISHERSECIGLIFHVPDSEVDALIRELDYREKGGYNRHVISIELLESTPIHNEGEIVSAIVYTGINMRMIGLVFFSLHLRCLFRQRR